MLTSEMQFTKDAFVASEIIEVRKYWLLGLIGEVEALCTGRHKPSYLLL